MKIDKQASIVLITLSLLFCNRVTAGNSSSGGGDVYGDTLNPWFLENTANVGYCIEADREHFHLPADRIAAIVRSALESWKTAFGHAKRDWYAPGEVEPFGQVRLATQTFTQEDCTNTTPLRFQFGVLSLDQRRDFLPDPTGVIAQTIRTDYDRVSLRGRGFIYVAADSGTLRPKGLKMAGQPWAFQNGIILKRILLHELGHVFGLSHMGSAYDLMGQAHPEYVVQQSTIESLAKQPAEQMEKALDRIGVFGFEFPAIQEICDTSTVVIITDPTSSFFGIPKNWTCRKFLFTPNKIEVYAAPQPGQSYQLMGSTAWANPTESSAALLRIKLSKKQLVFQKIPAQAAQTGYLDGPAAVSRHVIISTYSGPEEKKGTIKAIFAPNQLIEMDAISNDQIIPIFDHGG
jgi:hypothetical protein